jgi:epoxyqueuosine reductase
VTVRHEAARSGAAADDRERVARAAVVKGRALALGFTAAGIATLEPVPHADALERWLAAGYDATMRWMRRQAASRREPARLLPGASVAVVTLTNYLHSREWVDRGAAPRGHGTDAPSGRRPRVAQYAWTTDYHEVLGERLERLAAAIRTVVPDSRTRCYVDAGPVPERELAQRAGLGWIGKNTMLIRPDIGSFTFIGVVLTDADLAPDEPFAADRCGSCRACLDACPTGAFPTERVLDAGRCISYLTIEHRGEFDREQRARTGAWVFGCDVCQDVCPWNERFATVTTDAALAPRAEVASPDLVALLDATPADFADRYGDTAFERPGPDGMRRNAAAVLYNARRA